MSKKRSKIRKKVKNNKQKPLKIMNDNFYEEIVICQRKGCNNISDNIVQLRVNEKKVNDVFLCKEHADELEYKLAPEWLEDFKKIQNDDEINSIELSVN